jgi:hypothetical protein
MCHTLCTCSAAAGLNAHAVDKLNGTHATPTEGQAYYDQQPELLESLFYLWRFTGNETYRDWGWQIFRAVRMWTRWVGCSRLMWSPALSGTTELCHSMT